MSGERSPRRAAAWLIAGLTALVAAAPAAQAAPSTAWIGNQFQVDVPNVVKRANIVVGSPPAQPAAADAARQRADGRGGVGGERLHRPDQPHRHVADAPLARPGRRSPASQALTSASDYSASVDLYDAVYRQQGGGMTATTYVRADKDELVIDVTGADPNIDPDRAHQPPERPQPHGRRERRRSRAWPRRGSTPAAPRGAPARRSARSRRSPRAGRTSPRRSSTRAPPRSPSSPTPTARSASSSPARPGPAATRRPPRRA